MATNITPTELKSLSFASFALSDEVKYRLRVLSALNPSDKLYTQTIEDILNTAIPLTAGSQTINQWMSHLSKEDVLTTKANQVELSLRLAAAERFKLLADDCMNGVLWHVFNLTEDDVDQQNPGLNPLAVPYHDRQGSNSGHATTYSSFSPAQTNNAVMLAQALTPSGKSGSYFTVTPAQTPANKVDRGYAKSAQSMNIAPKSIAQAHAQAQAHAHAQAHAQAQAQAHAPTSAPKVHSEVGGFSSEQELLATDIVTNSPTSHDKGSSVREGSQSAHKNLKTPSNSNASIETWKSDEPAENGEDWDKQETIAKKMTIDIPKVSIGLDSGVLVHGKAVETKGQEKSKGMTSIHDHSTSLQTKEPGYISSLDVGSSKFLKSIENNRVSEFMHSRYRPTVQAEETATASEDLHIWATELDIETDDIQIFSISETLPWPERLVVSAMLRTFGSGTFELFRKVIGRKTNTGGYFAVFGQLNDDFEPELCIVGPVDRAGDNEMGFFAKFEPVSPGLCQLCKRRHDGKLCRNVEHVDMYGLLRVNRVEEPSLLD